MIIREYLNKDWSRICEIHDLARLDELRSASLDSAFLPLKIAAKNEDLFKYKILVAEHKSEVVGFIAYSEEEIAWLYVDPANYRNGVGKALVEAVVGSQDHIFSIEVLKGNNTALDFYRSVGFSVTGMASGLMPGNEEYEVTVHELNNTKNS
ncbi:GNAT family N-acetyltransferase [Teredinibacter turnerae]|uniref:GNAT family N-acetyltransferase n=1 Tax=Teredinibacter turnerae TaxID=2426 RepID=UPI00036F2CC9|nr:GNAT family N-acetyltransferase [Teredinibacter turnerae]